MSGSRIRPVGTITRGTTGRQRLRRIDRWVLATQDTLLRQPDAHVVDLGYGAHGTTVVEWAERTWKTLPHVTFIGVEIDPERVQGAKHLERPGLAFQLGGFELAGITRPVTILRAFNVLRQYPEADVPSAWALMQESLATDGILIDGTCSESGRRASWVTLDRTQPRSLTLAMNFGDFEQPSDIAERLPKSLIHRNIPGEPIHSYLTALDLAWRNCAHLSAFGARQRWITTVTTLRDQGWPILDTLRRWRQGEITVQYDAVAPMP